MECAGRRRSNGAADRARSRQERAQGWHCAWRWHPEIREHRGCKFVRPEHPWREGRSSARRAPGRARANHERQPVALTPRPIRLLIIGRIKPGAEQKLREAQASFPHDAANEAGIDAIEAFIGSGFYVVQFEISRDDIQHVLSTFFNDDRVRRFRADLEPIVDNLPEPRLPLRSRRSLPSRRSRGCLPNRLQHRQSPLRRQHVPLAGRRAAADRQDAPRTIGRLIHKRPPTTRPVSASGVRPLRAHPGQVYGRAISGISTERVPSCLAQTVFISRGGECGDGYRRLRRPAPPRPGLTPQTGRPRSAISPRGGEGHPAPRPLLSPRGFSLPGRPEALATFRRQATVSCRLISGRARAASADLTPGPFRGDRPGRWATGGRRGSRQDTAHSQSVESAVRDSCHSDVRRNLGARGTPFRRGRDPSPRPERHDVGTAL